MGKIPLILIIALFSVSTQSLIAQQNNVNSSLERATDTIDPDNYNHLLFEQVVLNKINEVLKDKGKDTFRMKENLYLAARDQAIYMAKNKKVTTYQPFREREFTAIRVAYYGGSMVAQEIVEKTNLKKDREYLSYEQACINLVNKLFANKKNAEQLLNRQFYLIGLGAYPDSNYKRVYVSMVLGNFKSDNLGAKLKHTLPIPYTDKYTALTAPHKEYCRKINKTPRIFEFQQKLKVKGKLIYFDTDNAKTFYKLLRNTHDGIAVDILQEDQFSCNHKNIVNYNNLNRGILTKPIYKNKIYRKNKANTDSNRYALNVKIGKLPKDLNGPYELNLVLIQNKSFCISIPQSFLITTEGKYRHKVNYMANIDAGAYKPIADSIVLNFKIPFEKNKYTFKNKDIEPFIKLLNEPEFIIYKLNVKAYSSIEGSVKKNISLQKQREISILKALQVRQKDSIETISSTDFNWVDFKQDIENTEYGYLAELSMTEAQLEIKKQKKYKELEPILKNHRYAEVEMHVRYNIEGEKEPAFVLNKFNKALKTGNISLALNIQKYIINRVTQYKYHDSIICFMKLPKSTEYTNLRMNQLYIMQQLGKISDSLFLEELNHLHEINPSDAFVSYNLLLSTINRSAISYLTENRLIIQTNIERLYATALAEEQIDALNIKYQMKIITSADSTPLDHKMHKECVNTLKEIVNIKDESMGNSKKLAAIYIENDEYRLAKEALEQWALISDDEELLFTYISLCSLNEWDMHTQTFNAAMTHAYAINTDRFCELFYSDKFSLRIFENSEIKDLYCNPCQLKQNIAKDK